MSRFFSHTTAGLQPYTPGEQPRDRQYIKLNTNECPYPPSPRVREILQKADTQSLRLYPDPQSLVLREAIARQYGLRTEQVFAGGGSDEVLAYAFMAFFDRGDRVCFPDITYGFYKVYAALFGLHAQELALQEDFSVCIGDYLAADIPVFLANPNAPTGLCLPRGQIERIICKNPDRLVVVDEAYMDFADEQSCTGLIDTYDNLLVVRTFSKSRALAGMRIGMGLGNAALIDGLVRIQYSFNPYNMDRLSQAVGIAALQDDAYFKESVGKICATRERVTSALRGMGFTVLSSQANFLFASPPDKNGEQLYERLRQSGILVRYFGAHPATAPYVRITIGTDAEMDIFLTKTQQIMQVGLQN